jgi:hypothetical protein
MTLGKLRGLLYKAARLLGDVQSIRHHRVIKRVHNRIVGHAAARLLRRIWR